VLAKEEHRLKMVFISRVSKMKNLDGALKSLTRVQNKIEYCVYGTIEDKQYYNECMRIAKLLPKNVYVKFYGEYKPDELIEKISDYDCLFLPTHHENFGHAILEALRAGLPVLISKNTPWDDIEIRGCGWKYSPDEYNAFARKIDELAAMKPDKFHELKNNALKYAQDYAQKSDIIKQNIDMFESV
jgi:glycosyltransferase involved in cell wall biosynthesis